VPSKRHSRNSWRSIEELGSPSGTYGGPGEEHSLIGEDWGHDRAEMGLRRREWEGGEQR